MEESTYGRRRFLAVLGLTAIAGCAGDGGGGVDGGGGGGGTRTQSPTTSPLPTTVDDEASTSPPTEATPEETPTETPEDLVADVTIGEVVQGDNLAMVVRERTQTKSIGEYQEADAGNTFHVVRLAIKNRHGGEYVSFSSLLQTRLVDAEDYTYDPSFSFTDYPIGQGKLAPGEVSRGDIVFEVPTDASGLRLEFDFEAFSFFKFDRVTVNLGQQANQIGDLRQTLQVPVHGPGESVSESGTAAVANSFETATSVGEYTQADQGKEYAIVDISVTNNTGDEQHVSILGQMDLKDGRGFTYTVDIGAYSQLDRQFEQGSALASGQTRRGKIAYEVDQGTSPLYWTFDFSLFASGTKSFWQLR